MFLYLIVIFHKIKKKTSNIPVMCSYRGLSSKLCLKSFLNNNIIILLIMPVLKFSKYFQFSHEAIFYGVERPECKI